MLQNIRQEVIERLRNTKFKVIDLVSLMQAEIRLGNTEQIMDLQRLITMSPEEINTKIIVNLVELYSEIPHDQLLP